jgi:N-acetylglucosaminyldiphosphoundecaprenol N-acetyl-beta-D-mannosaminyltransferase
MVRRTDFFGVDVADLAAADFADALVAKVRSVGGPINVMSLNLTSLRRFTPEMWDFSQRFDFVTADGNGLVRLSGLMGATIRHQIPISTLSQLLLERAARDGLRVLLLGGSEKANSAALHNVRRRLPDLHVSGHHGYFDEGAYQAIANLVAERRPDIVLVGISSPKKERVILEIASRFDRSINIACGGFIDILAGRTKRAPQFIQKHSLEWIYRFVQEPRRMFGPMILGGFYFLFRLLPRFLAYRAWGVKANLLQVVSPSSPVFEVPVSTDMTLPVAD